MMSRIAPLFIAAALVLVACEQQAPRAKNAQVVKLLPDTPPPPPPPKPEERRPEPQKEDKAQPTPEPQPAPQPDAPTLKSDEAPGQGPGSGIAAGAVTQDYAGGALGAGSGAPAAGPNRLVAQSYAQATTRALNDFLSGEKALRQADYRLTVNVWLKPDGRLQRAQLAGSTGSTNLDATLQEALLRFPGAPSPMPDGMPQPIRLRISNHMIG